MTISSLLQMAATPNFESTIPLVGPAPLCGVKPKVKLLRSHWLAQKWGRLQLNPDQELPDAWGAGVHYKFGFICDCGRNTNPAFKSVTNGDSTSCGRCLWKSKGYWLEQCWGSLRLDSTQILPDEWGKGTERKFLFNCNCGRSTSMSMNAVCVNRSCGKCQWKTKDQWLSEHWGDLTLDPNQDLVGEWGPKVNYKFRFRCTCGRRTCIPMSSAGRNKSCGKCTYHDKGFWLSQKWGTLRFAVDQELPDEWATASNKKAYFICDCGRRSYLTIASVTSSVSQSCGRCLFKPKSYWLTQEWGTLKLDPNQDLPDEWGSGCREKFHFRCRCGGSTEVVFYGIFRAQSCGCLKPGENEFSPEAEVRDFVKTLAPGTYPNSYPIEGSRRKYDAYVPSNNLAIEYHGLPWHSEKFNLGVSVKKDYKKYQLAQSRGDRLIQIYGDEWSDPTKQEIIKAMLRDILAPEEKVRIKPTFKVITGCTPSNVKTFLDAHHYLGAASGCVTIVARHREAIVGAWVFMKRETGVVLWHRACWDRRYKSWNPHEKALKMALPLLKEMGFTRMVTFSDNRFHTGNLYEKLRFTFEKELKPDYSYMNNNVRKSKYALRVPAGVNEVEEAAKKGWYRIWDSGKKRYGLSI